MLTETSAAPRCIEKRESLGLTQTLHVCVTLFLLATYGGCDADRVANTPIPDVSTNTQVDLGHDHKHLHGDPHQHDHQHAGDFEGAHAHPHVHAHRHLPTPHGGHLIHVDRDTPASAADSDRESEGLLHLEAVVTRDRFEIFPIIESESGEFADVELAVKTAQVSLSVGEIQWQGKLQKAGDHTGYQCELAAPLVSAMSSVDGKVTLSVDNISIGNLSSTKPEVISVSTSPLDTDLD